MRNILNIAFAIQTTFEKKMSIYYKNILYLIIRDLYIKILFRI